MRIPRMLRAALPLAALGAILGTATATTVERLDFKGLTHLATNVVTGTVQDTRFEYTPDGGLIVTMTGVKLDAQWKGAIAEPNLTVRTPGGSIGSVIIEVPGTPVLKAGEQVLLFLEKNPDGTYGVISFAQGSFKLTANQDGDVVVSRDSGAASLTAVNGKEKGAIAAGTWTLATVKADVDAQIAADAKPKAKDAKSETDADVVPLDDVKSTGGGR